MHECLEIPEILDQIMRYIPPPPVNVTARKHLLSCALTSRYFLGVALDIIWHSQTNLFFLLRTLPPSLWRDRGPAYSGVFQTRIPSVAEWGRLKSFYASRIRRISYLPSGFHKATDDLSSLLKICSSIDESPTSPVFPNLLHLEFTRMQDAAFCMDIFLRTRGISLSLQLMDTSRADDMRMVQNIYPAITQHALNMHELDLGSVESPVANVNNELSNVVCKMTQLRGLATGHRKLTKNARRHLALLPHLGKLITVNNSDEILQAVVSVPKAIFPSLHHLEMRELGPMKAFAGLITKIRPRLHTLTLYFDAIPSAFDVQTSLDVLSRCSHDHRSLRKVTIKYSPPPRETPKAGVWIPGSPIPFQSLEGNADHHTLAPLYPFSNISHLVIDLPWNFHLGDSDIELIAQSWPQLRVLMIGSMKGWGATSLVTANGVVTLVKGCKELEKISIQFDATIPPPALDSLPEDLENHKVDYLYVGRSAVKTDTTQRIAAFLNRLFPRLIGIGGCWLSAMDEERAGDNGDGLADMWDQLVDEIKSLRK